MITIHFIAQGNRLKDSGYTLEEEEIIYDDNLQDIYNNPRWYLNNLDSLSEYRVRWNDYSTKTAVLPYKHVKKRKTYK